MDIHKPKAAHSPKEFAIELVTILVGVLIALAAEALVEHHRIADAVEFSRADFVNELGQNRAVARQDLRETQALHQQLAALIRDETRMARGLGSAGANHNVARNFIKLRSAAWSSALSTQVIGHFPHAQGRAVAAAYSEQEVFAGRQQAEQAIWFQLADGVFVDAPTKPEITSGIKRQMVAFTYLKAHEDSERSLIRTYDAALAQLGRR